ncbi:MULTISPECIES: hypothetical protein [unclassified Archaeoglobus]|mgnify:CR=1 FL=1|jgi:hypothetical protein|uniref:hypothetical protein n=1 Tax=unclassified Archaeoglobus TaxID=2643606 RepID=UPI0025B920F5|nr:MULTISPECIES: hypothetical protein [unclassified Archaeoglobus]
MPFEKKLFVECKTDMLLVTKMSFKRCVICAGGIGEVCNKLRDSTNSCGLVDEDPTKSRPSYLENLLKNAIILNKHDIIVAHDKERNNYLIVLSPDREGWLIQTAKILGLDFRIFNLPNNPKEFKKISLLNPQKVEPLINSILSRGHPRIDELRKAFLRCKEAVSE